MLCPLLYRTEHFSRGEKGKRNWGGGGWPAKKPERKKGCVLSGTSVWRPQSRYTVSRIECRIKFPQNQRCRAKIALHPPKSRCRTFLRTPLSHFPLMRSRQEAKGGCRGGLVEGIAALLGSEKGSRYRGMSQLQSHQSRYSVQLRMRENKSLKK